MVLRKTLPKQCVWLTLNNMRSFKNISISSPPLPCWAGDAALAAASWDACMGWPWGWRRQLHTDHCGPRSVSLHPPPRLLLGTCELRVWAVRGQSGFCVKWCWRCREVPVRLLEHLRHSLLGQSHPQGWEWSRHFRSHSCLCPMIRLTSQHTRSCGVILSDYLNRWSCCL